MAPKNVKCKRFIAGLCKNTKNKQCPCYPKTGDVRTYLPVYRPRGRRTRLKYAPSAGNGTPRGVLLANFNIGIYYNFMSLISSNQM